MSFPLMNKRAKQAVAIPDLSGGINLRDSVSAIQDNQMTESLNMWYHDGVLKTRPGVANMNYWDEGLFTYANLKPHDIYKEVNGAVCRLFSGVNDNRIVFCWVGKGVFERLPSIVVKKSQYFVFQKGEKIFCFVSPGKEIYVLYPEKENWDNILEDTFEELDQLYIPLLSINNMPIGTDSTEATALEPRNILTNYYRMKFSTVDENRDSNEMRYKLLFPVCDGDYGEWSLEGCYVIAEITDIQGITTKHRVSLTNLEVSVEEKNTDGLRMRVTTSEIDFIDENNNVVSITKEKFLRNNMVVTAPFHTVVNEKMLEVEAYQDCLIDYRYKLFEMSQATWFGGGSEGINGGTRLFLCGNKSEPNLVIWSDLNNPLYFPENNYFYVGESDSAVTGFGKQSDMLVIFKPHETYFTQYNYKSGLTAAELTTQSKIDITTANVVFPLTLINTNIGCDCPNTVQLCRNRLVWANSNGRIYTLVSNNQYSERNIFELGEMVYRKLKTEKQLKDACSADWNGHYLLLVPNSENNLGDLNIYVMDYNSYGYQYVSSYSKNEDANLKIPWYFWQLWFGRNGVSKSIAANCGDDLVICQGYAYGMYYAVLDENVNFDRIVHTVDTKQEYRTTDYPIKSEITTKLFEFGAQGYYKNIDKVCLSLGNNGAKPVTVSFVTDMGTESTQVTLNGADTKQFSAGYIKSVQLNPCIRQVERFGVRLSCDGPLAVDTITLNYRITGGVR